MKMQMNRRMSKENGREMSKIIQQKVSEKALVYIDVEKVVWSLSIFFLPMNFFLPHLVIQDEFPVSRFCISTRSSSTSKWDFNCCINNSQWQREFLVDTNQINLLFQFHLVLWFFIKNSQEYIWMQKGELLRRTILFFKYFLTIFVTLCSNL